MIPNGLRCLPPIPLSPAGVLSGLRRSLLSVTPRTWGA
jgi:hypothetical protein